MEKRPRSERKLSTFEELKEIPSLADKIKVGERKGERGSRGPSCAGGFSYMEELGLDPKGNRDPLESTWQESDVTKAALWKTHSSFRVEDACGWTRVNLEAGDPLGGSWRPICR